MSSSQIFTRRRTFVLLTIVLIFLTPWIWYFLWRFGVRTHEFHYLVIGLVALLIGVLCSKMNGNIWIMLIILLVIPPLAHDLESYIMFEIRYANNEYHFLPSDFMPNGELYRDFDSYYAFSYCYDEDSFNYRIFQHLKSALVWLIVPLAYVLIQKNIVKPPHPTDLIDQ